MKVGNLVLVIKGLLISMFVTFVAILISWPIHELSIILMNKIRSPLGDYQAPEDIANLSFQFVSYLIPFVVILWVYKKALYRLGCVDEKAKIQRLFEHGGIFKSNLKRLKFWINLLWFSASWWLVMYFFYLTTISEYLFDGSLCSLFVTTAVFGLGGLFGWLYLVCLISSKQST